MRPRATPGLTLATLAALAMSGCLAQEAGCAGCSASAERGDDVVVAVQAVLVHCPPGASCASGPAPVEGAEVFLDGLRANVTGPDGRALLHGVQPGGHVLCVRRADVGNATVEWRAGQVLSSYPDGDTFKMMLNAGGRACP